MKTTLLIIAAVCAALFVPSGFSQDADETQTAAAEFTFSGKIVFHQDGGGHVIYELTVNNGQVSGRQIIPGQDQPVGTIVGGWFDFDQGRLSLLIQGADHVQARYRSQLQQFHVDLAARTVTLEHTLYDYGETTENSKVFAPHVLDSLDRVERLVK